VLLGDDAAFGVEVLLHGGEGVLDRFHPLAELRAGELLVEDGQLVLLAVGSAAASGMARAGVMTRTPSTSPKVSVPAGHRRGPGRAGPHLA
jgi:hypothetical protein